MRRPRTLRGTRARFLASALPNGRLTWEVSEAGSGESDRTFQRFTSRKTGESWILVECTARDQEWAPFVGIPRDLTAHTKLLPRIFHHNSRSGLVLMEDLGSSTLRGALSSMSPDATMRVEVVGSVVDSLIEWQAIDLDSSEFLSGRRFDQQSFIGESTFFAREFIAGYCSLAALLDGQWGIECERLAGEVADLDPACLHRDLHSENIMVTPEGVRFVDYASACVGPTEYDLAALLFDPLLELTPQDIDRLHHRLRASVSRGSEAEDRRALLVCAAQRLMNVLGSHARFVRHKRRCRRSSKSRPVAAIEK